MISISHLDDILIVKIAKFLNLKQIAKLFIMNKQFNKALQSQDLWKTLLYRYFQQTLIENPQNLQMDFFNLFKIQYSGIDWTDHITQMLQRCKLNPEQWKKAKIVYNYDEIEMQFKNMPLAYLKFYEQMNQEILKKVYNPQDRIFFFGGFKAYYDYYFYEFCDKPQISQTNQLYCFAKIQPGKIDLFVDIGNTLGFGNETIFAQLKSTEDKINYYILNRSLKSFLDERITKTDICQEVQPHIRYYDIIDTVVNAGSDTITQGIRIRATAKFCPWRQQQNQNMFIYQVRLSNAGVTSHYKLKSRVWKIQYQQHTENVEGEGVIGFYPEVKEGSQDFVYESCAMIDGFNGQISGAFIFEDLQTKQIVRAIINPFPLALNQEEALLSINQNSKFTVIADGRRQIVLDQQ